MLPCVSVQMTRRSKPVGTGEYAKTQLASYATNTTWWRCSSHVEAFPVLVLPTLINASIPPPTLAFSTSFLLYIGAQWRCGSRLHGKSGVACLPHELFQLVDSELGIATAVAPVYRSSACIWRHRLEAGVPFFRFPKRVEYAPESNIPIA